MQCHHFCEQCSSCAGGFPGQNESGSKSKHVQSSDTSSFSISRGLTSGTHMSIKKMKLSMKKDTLPVYAMPGAMIRTTVRGIEWSLRAFARMRAQRFSLRARALIKVSLASSEHSAKNSVPH